VLRYFLFGVSPAYKESKKRFNKALKEIVQTEPDINENSTVEVRIEFVRAFQELNNSFEAISTYDSYNNDMEKSKTMQEQVATLQDYVGIYNTVKGSLIDVDGNDEPLEDLKDVEFFGENIITSYDIDSLYINKLLGNYSANATDIRDEIEKALQNMKKCENVKNVYRDILNYIDNKEVDILKSS
jgi:type I restriction enzyme, R subunit